MSPSPLLKALEHHQAQRLEAAEAGYRQILAEDAQNAVVLCMLGILKKDTQKFDEAIDFLSRSIRINPDYPDAHGHLGELYVNQQNYSEALVCFERALALKPDYLDAIRGKGLILQLTDRPEEAVASFLSALDFIPANSNLHLMTSDLLRQLNRPDQALSHLDDALALEPNNPEALIRKGAVLQEKGRLAEALTYLDLAISHNGTLPGAYINKGLCLTLMADYQQAQACFDEALSLSPHNPEALSNKGVLMRILGHHQNAISNFRAAIAAAPDYAEAHQNLSFALFNTGQVEEALAEYEWRWKTPRSAPLYRTYNRPLWNGRSDLADKTLLLWPEQGPQDVTIWASVLPELVRKSGHCIINIYPKLVPLYQRSFPQAEVRPDPGSYDTAQDDFDYHLPMGSLFRYATPDRDDPARQDAYLSADTDRVDYWRHQLERLGPGPYIGISWKGVVTNPSRSPNYTEVKDWSGLIRSPATFISLQCGDAALERREFESQHGVAVHRFEELDLFDDLDDTAALAAALDAVISVSTAVSALAAGVGTPTWMIAWRQSPWHNFLLKSRGPNVSYFERDTDEPWDRVFNDLGARLQALAKER